MKSKAILFQAFINILGDRMNLYDLCLTVLFL
jgi:hypothetical protein